MLVEITLDGTTKTYDLEHAKRMFEKDYEECENLYSLKAQKLCYVLSLLKAGRTKINADSYYFG